MTHGIESITTTALGLALDAASLRQQAIASNIANANVDGYQALSVSFEAQLDDARRNVDRSGRLTAASLAGIAPRLEIVSERNASGVAPKVLLDVEVAHLAENGVHYQVLVKSLAKHYELISLAVKDGKG